MYGISSFAFSKSISCMCCTKPLHTSYICPMLASFSKLLMLALSFNIASPSLLLATPLPSSPSTLLRVFSSNRYRSRNKLSRLLYSPCFLLSHLFSSFHLVMVFSVTPTRSAIAFCVSVFSW